MTYKLLAADMDGTLLDGKKKISEKNIDMINFALERGKEVVFCTGRCLSELNEFFPLFPKMRYVLMESGACIYDLQEKRILYQQCMEEAAIEATLNYVRKKDVMIQVLADGLSYLPEWAMESLDKFYLPAYVNHFRKTATFVPDTYRLCRESGWHAEKICIYHTSPEERQKSLYFVREEKLHLTTAFSEKTSLEITPVGVDKGAALQRICSLAGFTIDEAIAIGDGMNDETVLRTAGLPVAVANADPKIREICQEIVSTNEDSGVAEAIERFLL